MDRIEEWAQHLLWKDIILPKVYNLNSIMRKPGRGTESLASPLQKYQGREGQEMAQELSRVKETEEAGQLNGMWDPGWERQTAAGKCLWGQLMKVDR